MSVITNNLLLGDEGYFLTKSLRLRSSASANLSNTSVSPTLGTKSTYSVWVKRGVLGSNMMALLDADQNGAGASYDEFGFESNDIIYFYSQGASAGFTTSAVFRDPSAWYHLVLAIDTTQTTASNRAKLYVNGVEQTFTAFGSITQNYVPQFQVSGRPRYIGRRYNGSPYFDGYLTEVNFIDGQALTPSSFGETSATTGVWIPKKYTGTYGTNGFYLPFTDVATTSGSNAGLGKDFSNNGNYWTTNNISVTSGSTYDSMKDVPTLTDTDTANYCVLNPLNSSGTVSGGNLNYSMGNTKAVATMAMTAGKYYSEVTINSTSNGLYVIGIGKVNTALNLFSLGVAYYADDGTKYVDGANSGYGSSYTAGDVIGIAVNFDSSQVTFYKNNTSQGAISLPSSTDGYTLVLQAASGSTSATFSVNFGQRPFAYTPPTGFKALNTFNLPTPTIGATASSQANKYFNVVSYSGNSPSSQTISVGFQPDFVWQKSRGQAYNHTLYDAVRGATKELYSNTTGAETTDSNGLTAFTSDGFTVGSDGELNDPTAAHVAWNWKANGSGSTNTAGSITSTVSANTTAGFSIVTYTGTGSNATVGHGLGVAPSMIITKSRNDATYGWTTYHASVGAGAALFLNTTGASNAGANIWNNTSPTSSVFSIGTDLYANFSGKTYVAYCFAEVAGYSKFGSYTGNGSSDGPFVFTGFRPKFILIKRTDTVESWELYDTSRSTYNTAVELLEANNSNAESTSSNNAFDILSNGFKLRGTRAATNASGGTYIYMAFAETPQKFSLGR